MNKVIHIKGLSIGEGAPKIVVPIVGKTRQAIMASASSTKHEKIDMIEWRVDFYEDALNREQVLKTLENLREIIPETPLIVTFRTQNEGGEKEISMSAYRALLMALSESGLVDFIDVELFSGDALVKEIIEHSHKNNVLIVASNHDFNKTPSRAELIERMCKMQGLGADILKIAVMPTCADDVLTLLSATNEMATQHAKQPIATMSMASMGVISRLSGEIFGSALTFGAMGQTSAPGQIDVQKLETVLKIIHETQV